MSSERLNPIQPAEARNTIAISNRALVGPVLPGRGLELATTMRYAILGPRDGLNLRSITQEGLPVIMRLDIEGEKRILFIAPPLRGNPLQAYILNIRYGNQEGAFQEAMSVVDQIQLDPQALEQLIGEGSTITFINYSRQVPRDNELLRRLGFTKPEVQAAKVERVAVCEIDDSISSREAVPLHQAFNI